MEDKEYNYSQFYTKLSSLCKRQYISVTRCCEDIGLSYAAATKWRRGSIPHRSTIKKIAEYLGIDVEFFFDDHYTDYDEWENEVKGITNTSDTDDSIVIEAADTLDDEFMLLAHKLTPSQVQREKDFMRGMLS